MNSAALPPSFNGDPFLYAAALTSVMTIACLGLSLSVWMARDIWRDRFCSHPLSLLFSYRLMAALIGLASFMRSMPEVLYLQVYNEPDVSMRVQNFILSGKRIADTLSLGVVLSWLMIFVCIYPHVVLTLRSGPALQVQADPLATWPRLVRPFVSFLCILTVAIAFAFSKVYAQ